MFNQLLKSLLIHEKMVTIIYKLRFFNLVHENGGVFIMAKRKSKAKKIKIAVPSQKHNGDCCGFHSSNSLGWILLIIGVLFLLKDLNLVKFWTINWYTLIFLFTGLWMIKK